MDILSVGNIHKEIQGEMPHRWTAFVRDRDGVAAKDLGIRAVTFHIHQDYTPSEIKITAAPFEVTRDGYGVFDVEMHIEMHDGDTYECTRNLDFEKDLSFEPLKGLVKQMGPKNKRAKTEKPVAKMEKPTAKSKMARKTAPKGKNSAAKTGKPAAKADKPVARAEKPLANADKPAANADKPAAKAGKPVAKAKKQALSTQLTFGNTHEEVGGEMPHRWTLFVRGPQGKLDDENPSLVVKQVAQCTFVDL